MGWKQDGMTAAERIKLNNLTAPLKSNVSASALPAVTDDSKEGYSVGSTWIYNGTTYTCTDATEGKAKWVSASDIFYFDTWAQLVAAISVEGTTYVNKHCQVANANGAPSSELTYTAPTAVDTIVDGGEAILLVNAQGTNYSVTCQPRTIKNPVVTSVMLLAANKPTVKGYYIFTVTPTNGLPSGIGLNDIAYFDGSTWSVYQKYTAAETVLVANTGSGVEVTWRKFNNTWMSTADEYIPDGNEYQTGKLWNGKAVYRKCISGTTQSSVDNNNHSTGISVPTTGTVIFCFATITRSTGTKQTVGGGGSSAFGVLSAGTVIYNSGSDIAWSSMPYTVWVEYTKV